MANRRQNGKDTGEPEGAQKVARMRAALRENFGKVVMAMMTLPRYRTQTLADLQHLVLDPMLHDRVAIAYPAPRDGDGPAPDMSGFAVWASVTEEVDASIRQQIADGVFPIRLKSDEWAGGDINWLLDVVARDRETAARVLANFRQVAKAGELHLHPVISRLVDGDALQKLGVRKTANEAPAS